MSRRRWLHAIVIAVVSACLFLLSGTVSAQGNSTNAFERVKEVQERHTEAMMAREGVVGTAVGLDDDGAHVVLVLLERAGVPSIPNQLDGVRVRPVVTGEFRALVKPAQPKKPGKPPKDTTPPVAPSGLKATSVSSSQIDLIWSLNTESDLSYYNVYRGATSGEPYTRTATNVKMTTYSNTGLAANTTYYYVVTAVDTSGNESQPSNEARATTQVGVTSPYPRPARIGISTGHPSITAGTIGCRVTKGGNVYALSNNHVYADENKASIGDNALQPGPYDGGQNPRDAIGTLAEFETIVFSRVANNKIDAAIALCTTATLDKRTPDGSYGTPSSTIVSNPAIGLGVMKHGRTTGLTTGQIYAVNATVSVRYDSGIARFVDQIIITPGTFSGGGDSGSLIVTQNGNNPVGLLFAGSSSYTIANRINEVLGAFGVTIDGK